MLYLLTKWYVQQKNCLALVATLEGWNVEIIKKTVNPQSSDSYVVREIQVKTPISVIRKSRLSF